MKRSIKFGILGCITLLILVIYHFPQSHRISMPVCTTEGDCATVEIDVKYFRRLFSLSYLDGTVTVDGITYYDSKSAWGPRQKGGSYWDWYWYWGDSDNTIPSNIQFVESENGIIGNSMLYIGYLGKNNTFSKIEFFLVSDDFPEGRIYYGPAQTAEEAEQIKLNQGRDTES